MTAATTPCNLPSSPTTMTPATTLFIEGSPLYQGPLLALKTTKKRWPTSPVLDNLGGARIRVTADRLASARPKERPAADSPSAEPTPRWCSDGGKERANVTGKSVRAVGLHPSWALGLDSTEAGYRVEKADFPSHPADLCLMD